MMSHKKEIDLVKSKIIEQNVPTKYAKGLAILCVLNCAYEGGDVMTPEDRALYDRLCKMQGKLFKAIGDIESIKISLASGGEMTESKRLVKKTGGAVCYDCGEELIAPADGQPYFCIECSQNRDYERRRQVDG